MKEDKVKRLVKMTRQMETAEDRFRKFKLDWKELYASLTPEEHVRYANLEVKYALGKLDKEGNER
jgi:hypothetical protein